MSFDYSMLDRQELPTGETFSKPLPITDGVVAQVIEGKFTGGQGKNGPWTRYDVTLEIRDEDYLGQAGLEAPQTVRYGIMCDVQNGALAMGPNKNLRLNRFRSACGCNVPGKTLSDCVGQMVKVAIAHRPDPEGQVDDNGEPVVYTDIKGVTRA